MCPRLSRDETCQICRICWSHAWAIRFSAIGGPLHAMSLSGFCSRISDSPQSLVERVVDYKYTCTYLFWDLSASQRPLMRHPSRRISSISTTYSQTIQRYIYTFVDGRLRNWLGHPRSWNTCHQSSQHGSSTFADGLANHSSCSQQFACHPPCVFGCIGEITVASLHGVRRDESPMVIMLRALPHKMQSSATTSVCDLDQQRDFSRAIVSRASNVPWADKQAWHDIGPSCCPRRKSHHTSRTSCGAHWSDVQRAFAHPDVFHVDVNEDNPNCR